MKSGVLNTKTLKYNITCNEEHRLLNNVNILSRYKTPQIAHLQITMYLDFLSSTTGILLNIQPFLYTTNQCVKQGLRGHS